MLVDHAEFDRWQDAAVSAGRAARVQEASGLHHWACFLAEQSAQLAVKGLGHGLGAGFWGHDLVELGEKVVVATGSPLEPAVGSALQRLSRHYIPARYPDAYPSGSPGAHYGPSDSAHALADLATIRSFVEGTWASAVEAERFEQDRPG